ncbi:23S rRNA (pseudouridine1915-N3)-methyltransferase [Marinitoga hydrogenitolerans DSM 16785]|uniref:Ribosomal RNA large subunit methyltransferase H n=1 Tax=Marinitoga hydrogenitolerans (strain DSM 16785 / JCM 12826 / AT1271) TaxID=1122195 RepID=A0A1M4VNM1_MARH1|nr:23S rRNA (pseudouridine(1915)-N(3))-methyltransferase RlmH [Marinitoga hydrogenitolerans]SHE70701.1 23S rRNA (pseudouridine1915-N3)-methyltransferase [Marinitoga hydrogenitolerans DSM 16785]
MIKIFVIGKPKTKFIKSGIEQYLKWNKKYDRVELIELPLSTDLNKITSEEYKKQDKEKFAKYYLPDVFKVVLDERGKELSSIEFANKIEKWRIGRKNISFFIGGPLGHHEEIRKNADFLLSISRMTFTHEMAVLLLLEQIYRAFKINNNEKYHY